MSALVFATVTATTANTTTAQDVSTRLAEWEVQRGAADPAQLRQLTGKVTVRARNDDRVLAEGTFRWTVQGERAYERYEFGGTTMERGIDGVAWSVDPQGVARLRKGPDAAALDRWFGLITRRPWKTLYAKAMAIDTAGDPSGGAPFDAFQMTSADGGVDTWHFARDGHELLRALMNVRDRDGKSATLDIELADWRRGTSPVWYAHRIQVTSPADVSTFVVETAGPVTLATLPFTPPPAVAALVAEEAEAERTRRAEAELRAAELQTPSFAIETRTKPNTATIRAKVAEASFAAERDKAIAEVAAALKAADVLPVGAPFCRVHARDAGNVDFEAGVVVAAPITATGRIAPGAWAAGRVVVGTHVGPHATLVKFREQLAAWLGARELTADGPAYEIFEVGPAETPDTTRWRTVVQQPVKG